MHASTDVNTSDDQQKSSGLWTFFLRPESKVVKSSDVYAETTRDLRDKGNPREALEGVAALNLRRSF